MKLYEQLGKLMQSFSFDTLIHSVLPALQKVIWATNGYRASSPQTVVEV